jgi:UDP-3-O-[3-hydroxymyristoyl] N-acetylglucosamine deacetylase/3-hydroxyacyl-[acyl-carrier-protein] dehydratase
MFEKQHTLAEPVSLKGPALHTGNTVTLTFQPAAENTGYQFRRKDLPDAPVIPARADLVQSVERATTIGEGHVKVHTVEHVLSALRGCGIDNAIIELDSNEPPIADGSAQQYVEMIHKAGITEQQAPRRYLELREPVHIIGKNGSSIVALPAEEFTISCTNVNHTGHFTQHHFYKLDSRDYPAEIASARTFVFYEEVTPLLEKGLIKGGSLKNAIVIRDDSIISEEPLRFNNEFARHKILDIIGDLALVPRHLKAHIIATGTGHALNVALAKKLYELHKDLESQLPRPVPITQSGLDIEEIMRILPHRYPFLMVDRILEITPGELPGAVGLKNVTINEAFFPGHFEGHPVMPGVLQLEAMAQVASVVFLKLLGHEGKVGYFLSADSVKWRKPVRPGDQLIIHAQLLKVKNRGRIGRVNAVCKVGDEIVSEGELTFALAEA